MPNVLILGANSDIAKACARKYAANNYSIWLAGRNLALLIVEARDLEIRFNAKVKLLYFDAVDFTSHRAFVKDLDFTPDIVIVAFGYLGNQSLAEIDLQETECIIHTNYTGSVTILNEIANLLEKNNSGIIIGISSIAGNRGKKSNYIYGSAKAGFTAYLSGLRNRLHPSGVHVLTVLPGYVNTKMIAGKNFPKLLVAEPELVASSIYEAALERKNILYSKSIWRYIMLIISHIPEFIYKKLNIG